MKTLMTANRMTERELMNYKRRRQRQKEIRQKCLIVAFTLILVMVLTFSFYAIKTNANSETDNLSYKYYTSIIIEYGDTLWSIAGNYIDEQYYNSTQEYISEVVSINRLRSEEIRAGQYLIVPYYSKEFVK